MITYREFLVDEYRRQDQMARAEQHRLLKSVRQKDANETNRLQSILDRLGGLLESVGRRVPPSNARHQPTFNA